MSNETSKAIKRLATDPLWQRVSRIPKPWLDIGPGENCLSGADPFDQIHGDANTLNDVPQSYYNLVWSSHCLEHMVDAAEALKVWWNVVAPGGYLWLQVPDAMLYEHGKWPSRFNGDHKWRLSAWRSGLTFADHHLNLAYMLESLPGSELIRLQLVDTNYDYHETLQDQTMKDDVEAGIEMVVRKSK